MKKIKEKNLKKLVPGNNIGVSLHKVQQWVIVVIIIFYKLPSHSFWLIEVAQVLSLIKQKSVAI